MDVDDLAVVLNSETEGVLLAGLRRFASQIRREHALHPSECHSSRRPLGSDEAAPGDAVAQARMDVDDSDGDPSGTDQEDDDHSSGSEESEPGRSGAMLKGRDDRKDGASSAAAAVAAALDAAAAGGHAPGLLGDYLRGSPQLNDLLALWNLDVRKSSRSVSAAHTDCIAAVLECLVAVLRRIADQASAAAAQGVSVETYDQGKTGAGAAEILVRGASVEATGMRLCRRLIQEKLDQLMEQLSSTGKMQQQGKPAKAADPGEKATAATLRLLTSMARFNRMAAKELAAVFKFHHKAFTKIVSRKGNAPARSETSVDEAPDEGAGALSGGKKGKKRRKAAEITVTTAEQELGAASRHASVRDDPRHLSLDFLCAFMDSDDPALQMQMMTGTRGGGPLGLVFRGCLWRDDPATSLLVVEMLQRKVLRNRRVSRRSKAEFFTGATIEHLRKIFDDAPSSLYDALHELMSCLLCDPVTSPFLMESAPSRDGLAVASLPTHDQGNSREAGDGFDKAVVTWSRPLLTGLACLGAHDDLGQRALLLSTLRMCPSLLGPYLRSLPHVMLEARSTYRHLQTYSLLAVLLREIPIAPVDGAEMGRGKPGDSLLAAVMPPLLSKKELTKGILSGNALLQAVTMNLMAQILERAIRVADFVKPKGARIVQHTATGDVAVASMVSRLRQRMPEVQTLLGLRDRIGAMSDKGGGSGGRGVASEQLNQQTQTKEPFLRWRLLSLIRLYARAIPAAVAAARFDFLKFLPLPSEGRRGLGHLHPLTQLTTLRLLAEESVVATPSALGAGSGRNRLSGWLEEHVGPAASSRAISQDRDPSELTPLGVVVRTAIDSTSPSIALAARALATQALESIGVVSSLFERGEGAGKAGRALGRKGMPGGEAGVWLGLLTPKVVGRFVLLVREAFADAHGLMTAGIRAAHQWMSGEDSECDWDVEFSLLSIEAMRFLSGIGSLDASRGPTPPSFEASNGTKVARAMPRGTPEPMSEGRKSDHTQTTGADEIDLEVARFCAMAVMRILYLHDNPRPFAALCLSFAAEAEASAASTESADNGKATAGKTTICQGLAAAITRMFGGVPGAKEAPGFGGDTREASATLRLLLKEARATTTTAAAVVMATGTAARLSASLEDNPDMNLFELEPFAEALVSSCGPGRGYDDHTPGVGTDAAPVASPEALDPFHVLLLPSLRLPRLISNALMFLQREDYESSTSDDQERRPVGRASLKGRSGERGVICLPAVDDRVFHVLARRLADAAPREAVAAVGQIACLLDAALSRLSCGAIGARVLGHARENVDDDMLLSAGDGKVLLETGIRLAAVACLGLVSRTPDTSISLSGGVNASKDVEVLAESSRKRPSQRLYTNRERAEREDVSDGAEREELSGAHDDYIFHTIARALRRPFLLNLSCPTPGETSDDRSDTDSLARTACTELSALLVAAVEAEQRFAGARTHDVDGLRKSLRGSVVIEAAGPFLERLCRSTAQAVRSGSPELRWLSAALVACRGACSGEALSAVLVALLAGLTQEVLPGAPLATNGRRAGHAAARRLLEDLLAPTRRRVGYHATDCGEGIAGLKRGDAAMVHWLEPTSVAALMNVQVGSPSPELARLVCLALTGSVHGDVDGQEERGAAAASIALSAGLLDDHAFFQHFFDRLVEDDEAKLIKTEDSGDSPDAMILAQLVRSSPNHAHRAAVGMPRVLSHLPAAQAVSTAVPPTSVRTAMASLLALRRPLEALLRTGALGSGLCAPWRAHRTVERACDESASAAKSSAGQSGAYPRLAALLSRCIIPMFFSATGIALAPPTGADVERAIPLEDSSSSGSAAAKRRLTMKRSILACLRTVLEEVDPSAEDTHEAGVADAVMAALRRSVDASEPIAASFSAEVLVHAEARSVLFLWLTADAGESEQLLAGRGDIEERSSGSVASREHKQRWIRRDYLMHCLSRATGAAKALGRAARLKDSARAASDGSGAIAGGDAAAAATAVATSRRGLLTGAQETLYEFWLDSATDLIGNAGSQQQDRLGGQSPPRHSLADAAAAPEANWLLGLRAASDESGAGVPGASGEVQAFLTAVLKHRLGDAASLRAVRAIAGVLYGGGTSPQARSAVRSDEWAKLSQTGAGGRLQHNSAVPSARAVRVWSAATMLERVVGHSNFLAVLTGETPARAEFLKLIVLLVSAGDEGDESTGKGARLALVRPLLTVYSASLSEEDQLIIRLLRLLQAGGAPLHPNLCRWGSAAAAVPASTRDLALPLDLAAGQVRKQPRAGCAWLVAAFEPRRLRISMEAFPVSREVEPPTFSFEVDGRGRLRDGQSTLIAETDVGLGASRKQDEGGGSDGSGDESLETDSERDDSSSGPEAGGSSDDDDEGGDSVSGAEDQGEDGASLVRGRDSGDRGELADRALELSAEGPSGTFEGCDNGDVYDPCFVLPLLEWALRTKSVPTQAVCESLLLGYIIAASSSLSLSTRASAFACMTYLLENLQPQEATASTLGSSAAIVGTNSRSSDVRKAPEASFRQRSQLALLLRTLRDGLETPLQRVPCAVALFLARASETLSLSPGSDLYKIVNSFLLHRPYIRLGELPFFETLFTGVPPGIGGSSSWGGIVLSATDNDPASVAKSRLWMIRALRDGMRTSQDLKIAAGKRAVPLLLAMADSPVGEADASVVGLILDVVCRVASLRQSGTRYLVNNVGIVGWCRAVLGRGLCEVSSVDALARAKGATAMSARGGPAATKARSATEAVANALPIELRVRILSLLRQLLAHGRQLLPHPPALLEEEFSLLAPDVVGYAAAAAMTSVEPDHKYRKGRKGGTRAAAAAAYATEGQTSADVVAQSIALLEDIQAGAYTQASLSIAEDVLIERQGPKTGLCLTVKDALSLSRSVSTVDGPPRVDLKGRTVVLLARAGALSRHSIRDALTSATLEGDAHALSAWALSSAEDELGSARPAGVGEGVAKLSVSSSSAASGVQRDGLGWKSRSSEHGTRGERVASAPDVMYAALRLVALLLSRRTAVVQHASSVAAPTGFPTTDFAGLPTTADEAIRATSMASEVLALARKASRLQQRIEAGNEPVGRKQERGHSSIWPAAVAAVLAILESLGPDEGKGPCVNASSVGRPASASTGVALAPSFPCVDRFALLRIVCRTLGQSPLLLPLKHFSEAESGDLGEEDAARAGQKGGFPLLVSWATQTAAHMLAAALPLPAPLLSSPAQMGEQGDIKEIPVQKQQLPVHEEAVDDRRALRICRATLDSVPPAFAKDEAVVHFIGDLNKAFEIFLGTASAGSTASVAEQDPTLSSSGRGTSRRDVGHSPATPSSRKKKRHKAGAGVPTR